MVGTPYKNGEHVTCNAHALRRSAHLTDDPLGEERGEHPLPHTTDIATTANAHNRPQGLVSKQRHGGECDPLAHHLRMQK